MFATGISQVAWRRCIWERRFELLGMVLLFLVASRGTGFRIFLFKLIQSLPGFLGFGAFGGSFCLFGFDLVPQFLRVAGIEVPCLLHLEQAKFVFHQSLFLRGVSESRAGSFDLGLQSVRRTWVGRGGCLPRVRLCPFLLLRRI